MLNINRHIRTLLLITVITITGGYGQTIVEDYNTGSIAQREDECWLFTNFEINSNNPITTTSPKKHGATMNMSYYGSVFNSATWYSSAGFTTPFYYFNGTGKVVFDHKADKDSWSYLSSQLDIYAIGTDGSTTLIHTHVYKSLGAWVNGDPTLVQNTSVSLPRGYYRLYFEWTDFSSWTEFYIDNLYFDIDTTSGVESATVCLGETVLHTPTTSIMPGAPYSFEYTWSWVGTPGGTITSQPGNTKTASVLWDQVAGTYRLKAIETYENGSCSGRTSFIDVRVLDQPLFDLPIDTVCKGEKPTMTFKATVGKAPFTVSYNDGSGQRSFVTTGNSYDVALQPDASNVSIISVVDNNGCDVDPVLLKSYPIYYHANPVTPPIYHY